MSAVQLPAIATPEGAVAATKVAIENIRLQKKNFASKYTNLLTVIEDIKPEEIKNREFVENTVDPSFEDLQKLEMDIQRNQNSVLAKHPELQEDLVKVEKKIEEYMRNMNLGIARFVSRINLDKGPRKNDDEKDNASVVKPNASLRPETLQLDQTPLELDHWTKRFEAFYKTSRLQKEDLEVQREYLNSCMDATVNHIMDVMAPSGTPVYDTDAQTVTCLSTLKSLWLERYPLFQRRHLYFTKSLSSRTVRDIPAFLSELEGLGRVAEIDKMTPTQLNAFRALSEIRDKDIRKACWKEKDLDMAKLRTIAIERAREYENFVSLRDDSKANVVKAEVGHANAVRDLSKVQCYDCKEYGHYANECPRRKKKARAAVAEDPESNEETDSSEDDDEDDDANGGEEEEPNDAQILAAKKGRKKSRYQKDKRKQFSSGVSQGENGKGAHKKSKKGRVRVATACAAQDATKMEEGKQLKNDTNVTSQILECYQEILP